MYCIGSSKRIQNIFIPPFTKKILSVFWTLQKSVESKLMTYCKHKQFPIYYRQKKK